MVADKRLEIGFSKSQNDYSQNTPPMSTSFLFPENSFSPSTTSLAKHMPKMNAGILAMAMMCPDVVKKGTTNKNELQNKTNGRLL